MTSAGASSPGLMIRSLSRIAALGRGLLYAKRAMSVRPARRRVRHAAAVRKGGATIEGWMRGFAHRFSLHGDSGTSVLRERSVT